LLFLTACLQQGSDKEKETEKPVEQEDKETEKPVEQEAKETEKPVEQEAKVSEMSIVAAKTASPAKQQLSLIRMFGWGSGASQTAVAPVEKPMKTAVVPVEKPSYNVVAAQNGRLGGQVSGRSRH
jgi:hypothetical protein